jgi:hypothetical protein
LTESISTKGLVITHAIMTRISEELRDKVRRLKLNGYHGFRLVKVRRKRKAFEEHSVNDQHQSITSKAESLNKAYVQLIEVIEGVHPYENF